MNEGDRVERQQTLSSADATLALGLAVSAWWLFAAALVGLASETVM